MNKEKECPNFKLDEWGICTYKQLWDNEDCEGNCLLKKKENIKMINKIKNLLTKTYKKVLIHKEYSSGIRYGYEPHHRVKSYITITRYFDLREGLRYVVTVPNVSYCYPKLQDALLRAIEHESIGMAKYNRLKEDLYKQNLFKTLDPNYKKYCQSI